MIYLTLRFSLGFQTRRNREITFIRPDKFFIHEYYLRQSIRSANRSAGVLATDCWSNRIFHALQEAVKYVIWCKTCETE